MSGPFRVALTFDAEHPDRPNDGQGTDRVLRELASAGVPATFFLQGRWVEAHPDLGRRIAADGHQVGNHSQYHARMNLFSDTGFAADVRAAESVIRRVLGVDPAPWFRLPFGSGADSPRLAGLLDALGYRHVGWDVDVKEWRRRETAARVRDRVVAGAMAHGDGVVVLLHAWPDPVGPALGGAIRALREAEATFVRVRDLPGGTSAS
jgi:peptidoglycan/xylan/chitin deacetylase (PgdA/CDA1 family)